MRTSRFLGPLASSFPLVLAACALSVAAACSSTSGGGGGGSGGGGNDGGVASGGGNEGGAGADGATRDAAGGSSDAAPIDDDASGAVNACSDSKFAASDHTASGDARLVSFPAGAAPAPYTPPCMQIKVGQSVTFKGSFTDHPMDSSGGDNGSPIQTTSTGDTVSFTFDTAGTFGFDCQNHPDLMKGAIRVVP